VKCALTAASSGRTTDDRYRRILPVPAGAGECPFAEPTTAVRRRRRQPFESGCEPLPGADEVI
jgi:hypothetical protein